jgi:hypothetical protein
VSSCLRYIKRENYTDSVVGGQPPAEAAAEEEHDEQSSESTEPPSSREASPKPSDEESDKEEVRVGRSPLPTPSPSRLSPVSVRGASEDRSSADPPTAGNSRASSESLEEDSGMAMEGLDGPLVQQVSADTSTLVVTPARAAEAGVANIRVPFDQLYSFERDLSKAIARELTEEDQRETFVELRDRFRAILRGDMP